MPGIDPGDIAVCIPIVALMIPIVSIWTKHQQRMAMIKARIGTKHVQASGADIDLVRAVNDLQREVSALRETTTRFDMSFDAALSRLESRVDGMEPGQASVATVTGYTSAPAAPELIVAGRSAASGDR